MARDSADHPEAKENFVFSLPRPMSLLRSSKSFKTRLIGVPVAYIGAAASALTINSTVPFNATNFPELTQYAALFDQCRVLRVHHEFTPYCSISSSNYSVSYGSMALFPDTDVPAISTTYGCLEADCNSGLRVIAGSTASNIMVDNKIRLTMTLKPSTVVGTTSPGSSWFDLSSAPTTYQLQGYLAPLSAVGVLTVLSWNWLEVEFRSRI